MTKQGCKTKPWSQKKNRGARKSVTKSCLSSVSWTLCNFLFFSTSFSFVFIALYPIVCVNRRYSIDLWRLREHVHLQRWLSAVKYDLKFRFFVIIVASFNRSPRQMRERERDKRTMIAVECINSEACAQLKYETSILNRRVIRNSVEMSEIVVRVWLIPFSERSAID